METFKEISSSHKIQSESWSVDPKSPFKFMTSQIDLFDLLKSQTSLLSSQSTNLDTTSTKTEDETSKSSASEQNLLKISKTTQKKKNDDKNMTIKEIISKRCYQRKTNQKNTKDAEGENKRKACSDISAEEENLSKRILVGQNSETTIAKKIVLKDGMPVLEESVENEFEVPLEISSEKKRNVTSNSFKPVSHSEKWSEKDTRKFYRALELFGTDFSLISKLFPNRNRNQIKNKYLKEEKLQKKKMDLALGQQRNSSGIQNIYKKAKIYLAQSSTSSGFMTKLEENEPSISDQLSNINPKRKIRSDSIHSTSSVDSLDMSIIENISDLFTK